MTESLLLRGREVAQLMGCSRALAYRLMQRGTIPTVRVSGGRTVRVPREALAEWIRTNTEIGPKDLIFDSGGEGLPQLLAEKEQSRTVKGLTAARSNQAVFGRK